MEREGVSVKIMGEVNVEKMVRCKRQARFPLLCVTSIATTMTLTPSKQRIFGIIALGKKMNPFFINLPEPY